MSAARYYLERSHRRFGPYSSVQLRKAASTGKLLETDLIVDIESGKSSPVAQVKGLELRVRSTDDGPERCDRCGVDLRRLQKSGVFTGKKFCPACDYTPGVCPNCSAMLRTKLAQQCVKCGSSWRTRTNTGQELTIPAETYRAAASEKTASVNQDSLEGRFAKRANVAGAVSLCIGLTVSWGVFLSRESILGGAFAGFFWGIATALGCFLMFVCPWLLIGGMVGGVIGILVSNHSPTQSVACGVGVLFGIFMEVLTAICWRHAWSRALELPVSIVQRGVLGVVLLCLVVPGVLLLRGEYWKAWKCVFDLDDI